jgi:hypothetical protein
MAEQCFRKPGSNPPTCGVHNVLLVEHHTISKSIAAWVGDFAFLLCPISDQVVKEPPTH